MHEAKLGDLRRGLGKLGLARLVSSAEDPASAPPSEESGSDDDQCASEGDASDMEEDPAFEELVMDVKAIKEVVTQNGMAIKALTQLLSNQPTTSFRPPQKPDATSGST